MPVRHHEGLRISNDFPASFPHLFHHDILTGQGSRCHIEREHVPEVRNEEEGLLIGARSRGTNNPRGPLDGQNRIFHISLHERWTL